MPKYSHVIYIYRVILSQEAPNYCLPANIQRVCQSTGDELTTGHYQQDGATCDTSNASMREIESIFLKDRIISKNLWPPRSPDLTSTDFFLWGLLKGKVHKNTPRTIEQLKDAIRQEIQAVNIDNLGKVFQNLEKRIQVCLDVKGDQFQHRLWASPVLHRCRYVYINFQVIISIT